MFIIFFFCLFLIRKLKMFWVYSMFLFLAVINSKIYIIQEVIFVTLELAVLSFLNFVVLVAFWTVLYSCLVYSHEKLCIGTVFFRYCLAPKNSAFCAESPLKKSSLIKCFCWSLPIIDILWMSFVRYECLNDFYVFFIIPIPHSLFLWMLVSQQDCRLYLLFQYFV